MTMTTRRLLRVVGTARPGAGEPRGGSTSGSESQAGAQESALGKRILPSRARKQTLGQYWVYGVEVRALLILYNVLHRSVCARGAVSVGTSPGSRGASICSARVSVLTPRVCSCVYDEHAAVEVRRRGEDEGVVSEGGQREQGDAGCVCREARDRAPRSFLGCCRPLLAI